MARSDRAAAGCAEALDGAGARQVLAWPTGWGGAARAGRKRPQQAQRHWRGFGVDGNGMKTLAYCRRRAAPAHLALRRLPLPLLPRQQILAQASAGSCGGNPGLCHMPTRAGAPECRRSPRLLGHHGQAARSWARSMVESAHDHRVVLPRSMPITKDLSILKPSTGSRLRYASDE